VHHVEFHIVRGGGAGKGGSAPREQTCTRSIAKSSLAVVQSQFHDGEDYFIATFTAYAAAPLAVIYYYGARAGAAQQIARDIASSTYCNCAMCVVISQISLGI
jgi:hypothetical protein